ARDLFVADRNFCTTRFVFGLQQQKAFVLVRQHRRNVPCQALERVQKVGETATGVVYEQRVQVSDPDSGALLTLRRLEVRLFHKTRDGERTLALLTNLPANVSA